MVLQATAKKDMSIDDLARTYIENMERQQRAQSTPRFPWRRATNERVPDFSTDTRLHSTSGRRIYCEVCGLPMNGQSICSGCRASPSRMWLQLFSLGTLGVLTAYNYIFVLKLLSTLTPRGHLASVWLNVSEFTWLYGWIVLGVYLPAWAYYGRKKYGYSLRAGVWVGVGFIVILLIGTVARPMFPRVGWSWAERLGTSLDSRPELGILVGWAVVALALISICSNCESRDRLMGRGKGLALLALTVLCITLGLSLLVTWQCGGRVA